MISCRFARNICLVVSRTQDWLSTKPEQGEQAAAPVSGDWFRFSRGLALLLFRIYTLYAVILEKSHWGGMEVSSFGKHQICQRWLWTFRIIATSLLFVSGRIGGHLRCWFNWLFFWIRVGLHFRWFLFLNRSFSSSLLIVWITWITWGFFCLLKAAFLTKDLTFFAGAVVSFPKL